jgi:DNA-binding response OmpR family regulator/anti-sigma regulatory factor (Ser/Thr protein kinase)
MMMTERSLIAGKRILLVDDDPIVINAAKTLLEMHSFVVDVAGDGSEALEIASLHQPDLVISDVVMPKMDGIGLLNACRRSDGLEEVPFIVLTGKDEETLRRTAMNTGADDFLRKPFHPDQILAAVSSQLKRQERSRQRRHTLLQQVKYRSIKKLEMELRTAIANIRDAAESSEHPRSHERLEASSAGGPMHEAVDTLHHMLENYLFYLYAENRYLFPYDAYKVSTEEVRIAARTVANRHGRIDDLRLRIGKFNMHIHPDYLKRIVFELVDNAMRYSPAGSAVTVITSITDDLVELTVQDCGAGMPKHLVEHLDAFTQHRRRIGSTGGLGLGLFIVQRITQVQNGLMEINSSPGNGATVKVILPRQ